MINYIFLFLLNLIIELCVALLLKYRTITHILGVIAVNGISHPILMLALSVVYKYGKSVVFLILLLEILVVISEWKLLELMFKKKDFTLLILSITMNTSSYIIGLLLNILNWRVIDEGSN